MVQHFQIQHKWYAAAVFAETQNLLALFPVIQMTEYNVRASSCFYKFMLKHLDIAQVQLLLQRTKKQSLDMLAQWHDTSQRERERLVDQSTNVFNC